MDEIKKRIEEGRTTLGIEFGSTRVKAVLVDETFQPIASGNYRWENQLVDGYWTYSLEEIITGLQESYQNMVLERSAFLLSGSGSRCKKAVWSGTYTDRLYGYQCHDARIYGI